MCGVEGHSVGSYCPTGYSLERLRTNHKFPVSLISDSVWADSSQSALPHSRCSDAAQLPPSKAHQRVLHDGITYYNLQALLRWPDSVLLAGRSQRDSD